ncbi:hypothetical protein [Roseisalinus antarcticus]|uniref:Uncharacterized protein n=1 Tax=Roseisalinus antarcticus TaxID=254357 RepID=A0A1Y5TJM1_9RHOB|nr:hypothetical protein [Roseisalinus antarcticus]SLN65649.1 hypothetical protein ROA7023_03088 [Roseisalinus antarcticus]
MAAPQQADLFLVPLLDGGDALGQVLECDARDRVRLLLTLSRDTAPRRIQLPEVVATLTTLPEPFRTGHWRVIGYDTLPTGPALKPPLFDPEPTDPAIVEAFLNACHGLYPWDGFPDAEVFSKMLLEGVALPPARTLRDA